MFKKAIILLFLLSLTSFNLFSQTLTQTIRGNVVDKTSQHPIPGAIVVLLNASPSKRVSTDENGKFKLNDVPVGQQSIKVTYMGYNEVVLQNLTVNSGKELVLTVAMEETVHRMETIEVTGTHDKNKSINQMSTVSTRMFSVEETQKFAAALNDPARMATSFAGVVQTGNGNNTISIRGNSPNGLLWRMEGVDIPNPNHFSSVGTSGGGISILSVQLLGNSDFSTGAFAAEYGNALSGVFDLKLRKGNNQKHEYTVQANFYGVDVAAEGPFKKGYDGSYLINYRYSTLLLLGKLKLPIGDAITNFQDLSFNISLPAARFGNFGIFGFGGTSSQTTVAIKDSTIWKDNDFKSLNTKFYANTAAAGITNTKLLGIRSYLKTALVFSGSGNGYYEDKLNQDYNPVRQYIENYIQEKITLTSSFNFKVNPKNSIRTGMIVSRLIYNLSQKQFADSINTLYEKINVDGTTYTDQLYFQWQNKITERFTTNMGMHFLHLVLNNTYSVEPRASMKYALTENQSLSLGYGLHSQIQPIGVYFAKQMQPNGEYITPNENVGLSKAHHFVLSYDINIKSVFHIKSEVYYQYLFNIPISNDVNNTFSMLNTVDGFTSTSLSNKGLGRNYGIELTLERFLYNNFYLLLSSSVYESKYQASNGNWYNTMYNTNFAVSLTSGKDWMLSEKYKKRIIGTNIKLIYTGGYRYTPIDLNSSIASHQEIDDETKSFAIRNPDYFRVDVRLSLKRNYKKLTSITAIDIQNASNQMNIAGRYFDTKSNSIKYYYQSGIIPLLSYRIEF